jgi:two-component system, cell cycle sensor histidine kinase and response regulator CckA
LITRTGERIDTIITTKLFRYKGEPAILGIVTDITEHKRLEEQLRQSQKMEGNRRLAGGVAHDFNNLLTGIIGYSDLLNRRIGRDDEDERDIDDIQKAALRAADLTSQLLAFSRKQIVQPKDLDLNEVVA